MFEVFELSIPFFGLIILGFVSGRLRAIPESGLEWMNFFILYVALPALFFQLLSRTPIQDLTNYQFVFATTLSTYATFAIAFVLAYLINRGHVGEATIQGFIGSYANVGYMGPPLSIAAFGAAAATPAALIFCFDVTLMFILAPILMTLGGIEKHSIGRAMGLAVWRVLTHPFILATAAGITAAAFQYRPPQMIDRFLEMLMGAAAPAALFVLGVSVAVRPLKRVPLELAPLLIIKLVVHPLIAFTVLTYVGGFDRLWIYTAVLMASLPPAATTFVIAQQYNQYVERASSAIMIGTAVSIMTVTGLLYLIVNQILVIP